MARSKVDWLTFRSEVLGLYEPPMRLRATWYKIRQVLDQVEILTGVNSPEELTARTIASYVKALSGCNPNTAAGHLGYLRTICRYAVSAGYLRRSPFDFRTDWLQAFDGEPEESAEPRRHHPAREIAAVLGLLRRESSSWDGGRLYALAMTVALTGIRKTEALRLRKGDVHLAEGFLEIGGTARRGRLRRKLKTKKSASPVPIPPELKAVLEDWLPRSGSADFVFPTKSGLKPWTSGSPGTKPLDRLKAAGLRAGVEGFTFLSLRHSFGTHAETLWGLSGPTIQRILRHTTEMTSLRWYRHPDADNLRRVSERISYSAASA